MAHSPVVAFVFGLLGIKGYENYSEVHGGKSVMAYFMRRLYKYSCLCVRLLTG